MARNYKNKFKISIFLFIDLIKKIEYTSNIILWRI